MTARRSSNPAALSNLSFQLPDLLALTSSFPFRVNKNCKFASDASEEWLLSLSSAPPSVSPSSETFSRQGAGYTGIDSLLSVSEKESLLGSKYGLLASLCSPTSDAPQLRILADFLALVWTSHIRILHGSRPSSRSTSNDSRPDGNPTWDQARGWAGAGAVHGHGWSAGSGWMSSMHVDSVEDGMELLEMNSLLKRYAMALTRRLFARLTPSLERPASSPASNAPHPASLHPISPAGTHNSHTLPNRSPKHNSRSTRTCGMDLSPLSQSTSR